MKIPPKKRKTSYSSLRRICRRLGLKLTTKSPPLDTRPDNP